MNNLYFKPLTCGEAIKLREERKKIELNVVCIFLRETVVYTIKKKIQIGPKVFNLPNNYGENLLHTNFFVLMF